jgi:hypothetical protein
VSRSSSQGFDSSDWRAARRPAPVHTRARASAALVEAGPRRTDIGALPARVRASLRTDGVTTALADEIEHIARQIHASLPAQRTGTTEPRRSGARACERSRRNPARGRSGVRHARRVTMTEELVVEPRNLSRRFGNIGGGPRCLALRSKGRELRCSGTEWRRQVDDAAHAVQHPLAIARKRPRRPRIRHDPRPSPALP